MRIHLALTLLALAGCKTAPSVPEVPSEAVVTVEVYRPWPSWMTDPLPESPPASQRVEHLLGSGNARLETIRAENCRKTLARRMNAGEEVSEADCPAVGQQAASSPARTK